MRSYEDQVAAALEDLPADVRTAALDDLRAALLDGATEADLGSPAEYADHVLDAFARSSDPADSEGAVFGVPFETRGPTDPLVRSRIWSPTDPRIFVPRMFGLGWTVNLGAVAVRLGLLRPDDWDDESLDEVDPRLLTALRYAPLVWAAAAAAIGIHTWRRGLPIPTRVDRGGNAVKWSQPSAALLPVAMAAGFAAWGSRPTKGDDRMIRPALGAAGAGLGCAVATVAARSVGHPERVSSGNAILAVAAAVLPAHVGLPVVVALHTRWKRR